jgi:hypothetical protein
MCHNAWTICNAIERQHIARAPHPPYSPDLDPCDFCLFGDLEHNLKDSELSTVLNDPALEITQFVFRNWTERLTSVIQNNG